MNSGDVFILDAGMVVFVWRGAKSSLAEKREGARLADVLKDKPGEKVMNIKRVSYMQMIPDNPR